jgi:hypothetical protein
MLPAAAAPCYPLVSVESAAVLSHASRPGRLSGFRARAHRLEISAGTRSAQAAAMYWLEVPRQLHDCRHVSSTSCN